VPLGLAMSVPVWSTPTPLALGLMALQGAGGLAAQLAVVVDFIRLPLAVALGYLLFGEAVELAVVAGGSIILCSLVLLFARERRAGQEPALPD
jgi:drug/metabolite transporter (DMT)-like permease